MTLANSRATVPDTMRNGRMILAALAALFAAFDAHWQLAGRDRELHRLGVLPANVHCVPFRSINARTRTT